MPWVLQMVGFALMLLGVAIALWVSVWVLLFLFAVGIVVVVWSHVRAYLTAKGILNPTFGVAPEAAASEAPVTIVEGDFVRVDAGAGPAVAPPDDAPRQDS